MIVICVNKTVHTQAQFIVLRCVPRERATCNRFHVSGQTQTLTHPLTQIWAKINVHALKCK